MAVMIIASHLWILTSTTTDTPDNKYVALLSGLNFGAGGDSSIRLEMLLEYLTGELGDSEVGSGLFVDTYVPLLTC